MVRLLRSFALCALVAAFGFVGCSGEETQAADDDDGTSLTGASSSGSGQGGGLTTTVGSGGSSVSSSGAGAGGSSGITTSSGSGGGGTTCMDVDEPNDSEATAVDLGTIDDNDASAGTVDGVLADGDEDWFKFIGTDTPVLYFVDPSRALTLPGNETVRRCIFVEGCTDPMDLTVTCPNNTSVSTSPDGRTGCCGTIDFEIDPSCGLIAGANLTVYIRLDQPPAQACVPYTMTYHY
jgi:hypothetical protein